MEGEPCTATLHIMFHAAKAAHLFPAAGATGAAMYQ